MHPGTVVQRNLDSSRITIAALIGTLDYSLRISYDAPIVTLGSVRNMPISSGLSFTLFGMNFGAVVDLTPTAQLGEEVCSTMSWTSNTALNCAPAAIVDPMIMDMLRKGGNYQAIVTVGAVAGTNPTRYTYDAPVISSYFNVNQAQSATGVVTISGLDFGSMDFTASTTIGSLNGNAIMTTTWTSATTVSVQQSLTHGYDGVIQVTVSALVGTSGNGLPGSVALTFDAPVVSSIPAPNVPISGGSFLTISGLDLGATNFSPTVSFSSSASSNVCLTTSWTTITTVS